MALVVAEPRARARAPAARRGPPVRRGRRPALVAPARRAAACARASPTTCSGCPYAVAPLRRRSPATPRARRARAVPRGPAARARRRTTRTSSPTRRREQRHALRALRRARIDRSLAVGAHGLPLMGTGDWNDGMNRVGAKGKGESVWLGWFLHAVLAAFAPIAEARGDAARADRVARRTCRRAAGRARAPRLGRRVVPPRLLRRRHAARLGDATTSAASTRSRSPGRALGRAPTRPRAARAMAAVDAVPGPPRRRAGPAVHAAVRPRRRSIPATSRATCPASARTAASTPTPRSGR